MFLKLAHLLQEAQSALTTAFYQEAVQVWHLQREVA